LASISFTSERKQDSVSANVDYQAKALDNSLEFL